VVAWADTVHAASPPPSAIDDELEALTLGVARGAVDAQALAIWFRQRLIRPD